MIIYSKMSKVISKFLIKKYKEAIILADFEKLADAVIKGNQDVVLEMTQNAVDEGVEPNEIINNGLISGMNVVGKRFKAGDMFVPEVLMSAKAMKGGMNIVKPLLLEGERPSDGKILLGTVSGDLHDFAKNVKEHNPDVLGMSALLTTTMLSMRDTIEILEEEGLRDSVKIMVGGAPVTKEFADEIGADGWAPDAASAKDLAFDLINK